MAKNAEIVTHLSVRVGGEALPQAIARNLAEVVVDQQTHLPGMFTIRLHDPGLKLLDQGPFDFQTTVDITARDQAGNDVTLMTGEITALEPSFEAGMSAELTVRGYDLSHRLYRERKSTTYLNIKDSDLALQFADAAGLKRDIEPTATVYDHLYQHNQSDLHFLMERAWRIGYECYVDRGTLVFRKPKTETAEITLTWGDDLLTFHPRLTLAEQVEEVLVKGWDVQEKKGIVGRANRGALYPKVNDRLREKAKAGGKLVLVDQCVTSQAEADILAAARLNEVSGSYLEAEGEAYRRPEVRAGRVVKLQSLGERFSGEYLVTSATHRYSASNLRTQFSVRGLRNGLLLAQLSTPTALERWPGVAPATVTNTDDPQQWGRVKVKYPWLSNDNESDWMRVASAGAGPQAGFCATPAVDDEVLVAFIHGNFGQPIVVGGLWNGKDAPPAPTQQAAEREKPLVRTWSSRTGHQITMHDNADNRIEVVTAAGHRVTLDDARQRISVRSQGGLEILLDDNGSEIRIQSGGKVLVKGNSDIQVESGGNLQIKAGGMLQIEAGANLELKANGSATLQGAARVAVQAPQISLG